MTNLEKMLEKIQPVSLEAVERAWNHWNNIAIPLHSLGRLQDTVVRIAGMTRSEKVDLKKKALIVMCADNGVVEEGVTQSGQEVTKIVAENFLQEKATASILCRKAGADIFPVDIGVASDTILINHKIAYGTKNMAKEPAMTRQQVCDAIEVGISMVGELKEKGYGIIATGEMGIGNTTTSSAITAVLLDAEPEKVTGKGAGLSSKGLEKKINTIKNAIKSHQPDKNDVVDVIAKVGGFDIAGLTGVFLGGALYQIPIVADGFISCTAALCAVRLNALVKDYVITSHKSKEPATNMILAALGIPVFLDCDMCLGEGSGAVTIFPILDMALAVYNSMSTFDDNEMEHYVPLA
ncbi:MAG: nicotinate-nucleotide--dimethylbenzimidazole phosphoribosyltransferase [Clostridia bacterium]|nr:nicotinate-nucleotide--dimethylbenzimidazole phosphoribosyltransferase [Clostridia bacterium]NCC43653.1 nicotinate-nucleotide--dimethylbenzimidazole phosphoribosyltransferase [Clostridia bacterium]